MTDYHDNFQRNTHPAESVTRAVASGGPFAVYKTLLKEVLGGMSFQLLYIEHPCVCL